MKASKAHVALPPNMADIRMIIQCIRIGSTYIAIHVLGMTPIASYPLLAEMVRMYSLLRFATST